MRAGVQTAHGVYRVDLDEEEVLELDADARLPAPPPVEVSLPLVLAAAAEGSRVVAVVDRRPPIVVSNDAGGSWRESGGGLPRGRAIAIAPGEPAGGLYGARNRLYLSTDGGTLWRGLAPELPEIEAVTFE